MGGRFFVDWRNRIEYNTHTWYTPYRHICVKQEISFSLSLYTFHYGPLILFSCRVCPINRRHASLPSLSSFLFIPPQQFIPCVMLSFSFVFNSLSILLHLLQIKQYPKRSDRMTEWEIAHEDNKPDTPRTLDTQQHRTKQCLHNEQRHVTPLLFFLFFLPKQE